MKFVFETIDDPAMMSSGIATFIVCETCGDKILGQHDGIVVFPDGQGSHTGRAMVIHKARCDTPETKRMQWQDLELFLRDVVRNTQIDLAETEVRITGPAGLASWGLHR